MASKTFYCPHCKKPNTKTDKLYLLSAAYEADSITIGLGNSPGESVRCIYCQRPVDTTQIIRGRYDKSRNDSRTETIVLFSIPAMILVLRFFAGWSWIGAGIAGLFLGAIAGGIIAEIINGLSKKAMMLLLLLPAAVYGQGPSYTDIILRGQSPGWAAAYDVVIGLPPKPGTINLKKWYLDRLNRDKVRSYLFNADKQLVDSAFVSIPGISSRMEWLKGFEAMLPRGNSGWWFSKKGGDYYRVINDDINGDSCCGCDDAPVFYARQVLTYDKGKLKVFNISLSPLCARKTDSGKVTWYSPGDFAFNTLVRRTKNAVLVSSSEVIYPAGGKKDAGLTLLANDNLADLLLGDVAAARISAYDPQTNKKIPANKILEWRMPLDTTAVYDSNGNFTPKVIRRKMDPANISRIRLSIDWYFDYATEKLFADVRSATLFSAIRMGDFSIDAPFARLQF